MSNAAVHEIWNGEAGRDWAENRADLDHFLGGSMAALLDLLPLAPGARVLEIGSGAGTFSLALARAVGPEGRVLGLDVSEPLLTLARRRGGRPSRSAVSTSRPRRWMPGASMSASRISA
ncbi:MAG: methyltransferase domain-containing protein [Rhodobacteraceae bacterium]|nr:MAG: methyltransferase domain-containing protein [Paracoccaceae bacterium]